MAWIDYDLLLLCLLCASSPCFAGTRHTGQGIGEIVFETWVLQPGWGRAMRILPLGLSSLPSE